MWRTPEMAASRHSGARSDPKTAMRMGWRTGQGWRRSWRNTRGIAVVFSASGFYFSTPPAHTDVFHATVEGNEPGRHPADPLRVEGRPRIFHGPIASANVLLKNPARRDALRDQFNVKAVEMEGSGIADVTWDRLLGYLVVCGVCDYCDSAKGDEWQHYAAAVAAAYTRALLEIVPVAEE